jgi:outer membrane protein assembly factor BamD (BamD/ComL family)
LAIRGLDAARAIQKASGCAAAIPPLEAIRQKYPSSEVGQAATWDVAECYAKTNRKELARSLFESLIASPKYAKRARLQLHALGSQ